MKKAVILLSGGLDSSTVLYYARARGFQPSCLVFDYGQRHRVELKRAAAIARQAGCPCRIVTIRLPWGASALLDKRIGLPKRKAVDPREIPVTYVPARNIIFLSFAASFAEAIGARAIFIGANAIDYSGYPDCRPEFFRAFQQALDRGLRSGVQKKTIKIYAPLLRKTKAQIIRMGLKLKVPYQRTWSCYSGGRRPCGACDSCLLRRRGFEETGLKDPLLVTRTPGHPSHV
ncbi:MAG: 7-cyano-7-deazaguanine synthase QueC [Candidatus Omnitrophica bacterium]|nr:7-cyano-7-deazaguanine synthase QueC [Candidatus Omnitrophota bacterium]